jgi:hypothetical protein
MGHAHFLKPAPNAVRRICLKNEQAQRFSFERARDPSKHSGFHSSTVTNDRANVEARCLGNLWSTFATTPPVDRRKPNFTDGWIMPIKIANFLTP